MFRKDVEKVQTQGKESVFKMKETNDIQLKRLISMYTDPKFMQAQAYPQAHRTKKPQKKLIEPKNKTDKNQVCSKLQQQHFYELSYYLW